VAERFHIERRPKRPGGQAEQVKMTVEFEWLPIGTLQVDIEERIISLPESRERGVYRICSSVRDESSAMSDAVYVGMATKDVDGRLRVHVRDDGKAFAANLAKDEGWAELDIAINPMVNGASGLNLADPRVLHLVEVVGIADALSFHNLQNKK
jgi:hypothetical protein